MILTVKLGGVITVFLGRTHRMDILALGKYYLSKTAALANTGNFGTGAREGIILGKHINASALLNGAAKRNAKRGRVFPF